MQVETQTNLVALTINVPSTVAARLGPDAQTIGRQLLELAAAEGYRSNRLSRGHVSTLLGLDWPETEEFLARHQCDRHYDLQDLEEDRKNLDRVLGPA